MKEEIFVCTPLEVKQPTSFQVEGDSPNHKEWMDDMKDDVDSKTRNKV